MRMRIIAACGALFLSIPAIHAQTPDTDPENSPPDTSSPPVTTSLPDTVRAPRTVEHPTHLRPGGFIWHPELAPSGDMSMTIDLSRQRAYIRRDGVCIGVTTVSTGKPGYETPTGEYTVLEKERYHRSNRYNNAPMPYMQRLTDYGMALHGGHLPGYPASHGCIRLPLAFAAALFREPSVGMTVTITDRSSREDDAGEYGTSDASTSATK